MSQAQDLNREQASGVAARLIAVDCLVSVLDKQRPLDEALAAHPGLAGLEPRDRAFVRLLVTTTLRRLGEIDMLIDSRLDRPLPKGAARVRHILRLGVAQLRFVGTPAHAAVGATVELAGGRMTKFRGLVNAILRGVDRDTGHRPSIEEAAMLDTPEWLLDTWTNAYGIDLTAAIALAHLADPPLDVTTKPGEEDRVAAMLDATPVADASILRGTVRRPVGGRIEDLPGFDKGLWWVQDVAAAIPARLLGDVSGRRVADLASAPGGKTAQLAAAGATVTAVDISRNRQEVTRRNLDRLGLDAEIVTADIMKWRYEQPFDAILLDVPCTATGTARRHPDVPHLKKPEDVTALSRRQTALIACAFQALAPGGTMVVACCSLQPEEGPDLIRDFLGRRENAERVPLSAEEMAGLEFAIDDAGDLRTLPCHLAEAGGMDGFHAARIRRLA